MSEAKMNLLRADLKQSRATLNVWGALLDRLAAAYGVNDVAPGELVHGRFEAAVDAAVRASPRPGALDECEAECAKLRASLLKQGLRVAELEEAAQYPPPMTEQERIINDACSRLSTTDPTCIAPAIEVLKMRITELEEAAQYPPPMERREAALLDMLREAQAEVVRLRLAAVGGGR